MEQTKKVLVSGASFAGLTTAYWLNKMGFKVTVVEIGVISKWAEHLLI